MRLRQRTVRALLALARRAAKTRDVLKWEAQQGGKFTTLISPADLLTVAETIDRLDMEITIALGQHDREQAEQQQRGPADEQDDRGEDPVEFTETPAGRRGRERWARRYNDHNGAPEGDSDR